MNSFSFFCHQHSAKSQSLCFRFTNIFGYWVLYHIVRFFQFLNVFVTLYIILLLCFICENNPHYFL